jgi:hypothetical protein
MLIVSNATGFESSDSLLANVSGVEHDSADGGLFETLRYFESAAMMLLKIFCHNNMATEYS